MKVLFGLYRPDEGGILLDDQPVQINSPHDAIALGIGMVHQHFMLLPSLTVAENIVLGMEPTSGGLIDRARARGLTQDLSQRYGLRVDADARIRDLSVGLRQRVEILKALARGANILILDEPTAVLTPQETDELFRILKELVQAGMTIIFITHKLREVMQISDRVTVMRAGKKIGTLDTADTNERDLARMMIGRDHIPVVHKEPAEPGDVVLQVRGLTATDDRGLPALRGVDLTVSSGEILGIAGVEGNGQTELVEVLVGLRKAESGDVRLFGRRVLNLPPRQIRDAGMAYIPEDRLQDGTAPTASIRDNLAMSRFDRPPIGNRWWMFPRRLARYARELVARFDVRTRDINLPVSSLSGGNIQKLVLARELSMQPDLLIAAQPSRGLDIGATENVHERLVAERDRGTAVLLVSAELSEVMALSDRIAVIFEGRITGVFQAADVTEEELGLYMLGIKRAGEAA
jgi:simple sugar transport system ATP-binding protein